MGRTSWHLLGRHGADFFGRVGYVGRVNTILVASRLGCVQAGLRSFVSTWIVSMSYETAYLNEVLSFRLGDQGLKLGGSEGVDQASLGDNEEKNLGASEDTELIGLRRGDDGQFWGTLSGRTPQHYLLHDTGLPLGEGNVTTRLVLDELDLDLPALATWFVVIVIVIVGRSRDAALGAVAGREVVLRGRLVGGGISDVSHVEDKEGIVSRLEGLIVLSGCPIELGCGCKELKVNDLSF